MTTEALKPVRKFKDLDITTVFTESEGYVGDFLTIEKILGKQFLIHHFKIIPSKFPDSGNGMCLWLQVTYRDEKRVITTNALKLQLIMQQVKPEMLPLETNITKGENNQFIFN